nr:G-protein coupled receptor Mth2-like [Crassostrea gigas]
MLSSEKFSGNIAVGIFIKQAVERVDIERRLFAITTKMVISRREVHSKFDLYLSLTMSTKQLYFNPYKIYLADYFLRCTLPPFVKYQVVANRQKYRTVRTSKLLTCVQVPLYFEEYRVDQQLRKLVVYGMNKIFDSNLFELLPDGSARVCAEDFNAGTDTVTYFLEERKRDFLLSTITLILHAISILCLMISFLIYVFKKDLRTIPGKINMILILSLALTLIIFQLSEFGSLQKRACVGFGIVLHYFWLVSFLTMSVSSFHMYRSFQFSNTNSRYHLNNIQAYMVFITFLPCMIIALNILISWLVLGNGDVGYGNRMCFIDNPYSRLASFIIPLGVMCICSLFFFVKTIISIRNVPKVPGNQSVRNEFVIFCRLFTITGITWVLQIIDGFLPFSTFSYISSIINSLQGIAIFVAFFLNKRVIDCKCMAQNDSHNKPLSKGESTVDSNTDVTRL